MYFNILTLTLPLEVLILNSIHPHFQGPLCRQSLKAKQLLGRDKDFELAVAMFVQADRFALVDARKNTFAV